MVNIATAKAPSPKDMDGPYFFPNDLKDSVWQMGRLFEKVSFEEPKLIELSVFSIICTLQLHGG
jgi:hypothetical protein